MTESTLRPWGLPPQERVFVLEKSLWACVFVFPPNLEGFIVFGRQWHAARCLSHFAVTNDCLSHLCGVMETV